MSATVTGCRQVTLLVLCFAFAGCYSLRPEMRPAEPQVRLNATHLSKAISEFGDLLQAYPPRWPYPLAEPLILDVCTIPNFSGESGLPEDLATVLTTILSEIGEAVVVKSPMTIVDRQMNMYRESVQDVGPVADFTICGSITEAEKRFSREFDIEMDMLFGDSDKGSGRNSIDSGASVGREQEVWTLTLDLRLVDRSGLVAKGVSNSIDVVKRGSSSSYGVFWRGSGVGVRDRSTVAQSKSHALRISAQQSIIMLLGRHLRVPYWRVLPGSEPDDALIGAYRQVLSTGQAPQDFRLLLFAHGLKVALDGTHFTEAENHGVVVLMGRLGLPATMSDLDLATHLWLNVPYKDHAGDHPPLRGLRRWLRNQPTAPAGNQQVALDTARAKIANLREGEEIILQVGFESGSSELTKTTKETLDLLLQALKDSGRFEGEDWWFELIGHSDARGERARNQQISESRAERVRTYLESMHSLPGGLIVSSGRGSEEPLSEEDHAKNRRVDVLLVIGDRPGSVQRKAGSVKNTALKSEHLPLFPAGQWPLPRGVVLPSRLAAATLSIVKSAYPTGRYSPSFKYYAIRFGQREPGLFDEVTFFFGGQERDPLVSWVGFRCKSDSEQMVIAAILESLPRGERGDHAEAPNSWLDSEGYRVTVKQGEFCLKIESPAL